MFSGGTRALTFGRDSGRADVGFMRAVRGTPCYVGQQCVRTAVPAQAPPAPSGPNLVQYGDRCFHGHRLPCDSRESCLEQLPPDLLQ